MGTRRFATYYAARLWACSFLYRISHHLSITWEILVTHLTGENREDTQLKQGADSGPTSRHCSTLVLSLTRSEVSKTIEQSRDSPRALQPLELGSEKDLPTASNPEDGSEVRQQFREYTLSSPNLPALPINEGEGRVGHVSWMPALCKTVADYPGLGRTR